MRRNLIFCALMVCVLFGNAGVLWGVINDADIIARGDANNDGSVNVSDVIYLNAYLYQSGPQPPCLNQADANKSGDVDGSDPVYLLNWLFSGGPAPPSPGPYATSCSTTSPYISCSAGC